MAGLDSGRKVETHLARLGFEFYNPRTVDEWLIKGRKVQRSVQLFPGYLFVNVVVQWSSLNGVPGSIGLITCDGLPQYLDDEEIERLKQDERAGVFLPVDSEKFTKGQKVKFTDEAGVFVGKTGIYRGMKGADRCAVLFSMMGREVVAEVTEAAIEAA